MKTFMNTFWVKAPIQPVTDFHSSTTALKRLTPFPIFVQIHNLEPLVKGRLLNSRCGLDPFQYAGMPGM
jgi:ligand-binding SRPBCC domain-containing protein